MPLLGSVLTSTHPWVWYGVSFGCAEDLPTVDLKRHGCGVVVTTAELRPLSSALET